MYYDNEENHMVLGNFETPDIEFVGFYDVSFMHDYDNDTEKATLELYVVGIVIDGNLTIYNEKEIIETLEELGFVNPCNFEIEGIGE